MKIFSQILKKNFLKLEFHRGKFRKIASHAQINEEYYIYNTVSFEIQSVQHLNSLISIYQNNCMESCELRRILAGFP